MIWSSIAVDALTNELYFVLSFVIWATIASVHSNRQFHLVGMQSFDVINDTIFCLR